MTPDEATAYEALLDEARADGAAEPTLALSSDDEPVIVDTKLNRTWFIELREF